MNRQILFTVITLIVVVVMTAVAILLTKGYSFSPNTGRLVGTGIISVSSLPTGASVYIDGHLTDATDTTIQSLSPKKYSVRIAKEGYINYEREVEVREGLVTEVIATLFPSIPTIYPLTYNGVVNTVISPDGKQLAFGVPMIIDGTSRQKGGVWVWTMDAGPIAFTRGAQPHQLVSSTTELDFSKATLRFSPDSSQVLVTLNTGQGTLERNYLLPVGSKTDIDSLRDVTPNIQATLKTWEEDVKVRELARLTTIKDLNTQKIASASGIVNWSPDETKFMIVEGIGSGVQGLEKSKQASPTTKPNTLEPSPLLKAKIYDLGTTEALLPAPKEYTLPEALSYTWLPDSEHVILTQQEDPKNPNSKKVVICEFDGLNCNVIYFGGFDEKAVFAWPDASRLMLITSFNTPTASTPNLFGINLK